MFTAGKSPPEPGPGPFHLPLCWWTCTLTGELWFLYGRNENLVHDYDNSPVGCMHGGLWIVNLCAVICLLINKTHLCRYLARFSCSLSLLYGNR